MRSRLLVAAALAACMAACTWETDLPEDARAIRVDARRELVVTDEAVLARVPGFERAWSRLALRDGAALEWLAAWSARLEAEGMPDRAEALSSSFTCRWLRAEPANECDASCASCKHRVLRPSAAPLRLVAIANRTDLSDMPDRAAEGGEGRLVFALAGDGPRNLPLEIILEYAQHGPAIEWARLWHALGAATDEELPSRLTALVERLVGGGTIAQIRTADRLAEPMVMHQFEIDDGAIVPARVRNTPEWRSVDEGALRAFVADHGAELAAGTFLLPREWWARSARADVPPPAWAERALVRQTCTGCHAQTAKGFQIDPEATGEARLSSFLRDPAGGRDELTRRTEWMQLTLHSSGDSQTLGSSAPQSRSFQAQVSEWSSTQSSSSKSLGSPSSQAR